MMKIRIAQVTLAQFVGDLAFELLGGVAARRHGADERDGQVAGLVDAVDVGQSFLLEHSDADPIAGAEAIGLVERFMKSGRRRPVAGAAGKQRHGEQRAEEGSSAFHDRTRTFDWPPLYRGKC
jgi:hypothetical protein